MTLVRATSGGASLGRAASRSGTARSRSRFPQPSDAVLHATSSERQVTDSRVELAAERERFRSPRRAGAASPSELSAGHARLRRTHSPFTLAAVTCHHDCHFSATPETHVRSARRNAGEREADLGWDRVGSARIGVRLIPRGIYWTMPRVRETCR